MTYYCTNADVSLGLALTLLKELEHQLVTSAIRRATVYIDSIYRDYGRVLQVVKSLLLL